MGFLDEPCLFHELTDEKITASKPFYCGNNDLDDFFHEDVTKFSYNLMGKSYCFVLEDDLYYPRKSLMDLYCKPEVG